MTGVILAPLYTRVKHGATQNGMISPAGLNRLGLLIRERREVLGLRQEDVADQLNVDRSLVSQWERGDNKRPIATEDVNKLAAVLDLPVLSLVVALGYEVLCPGFENEEEVALVEAYRQLTPDQRTVLRAAAGLPSARALRSSEGSALRRQMGPRRRTGEST